MSRKNSFIHRLVLAFVISVICIAAGIASYNALQFRLIEVMVKARDLDERLQTLARTEHMLTKLFKDIGNFATADEPDTHRDIIRREFDSALRSARSLPITDADVKALYEGISEAQRGTMEFLSQEDAPSRIAQLIGQFDLQRSEILEKSHELAIRWRRSLNESYAVIERDKSKPLMWSLLLLVFLMVSLSIVFFLFIKRLKSFLRNMSYGSMVLAEGRWDENLELTGGDEFGELESQFNDMKRKIAETQKELVRSNQDLRDFAQMVSHDLKAPLRYVSSYASLITDTRENLPAERAGEFSRNIQFSIQRLSRMIDDLLRFSSIGREDLVKERVRVRELIDPLTLEFSTFEKDMTVTVTGADSVVVFKTLLQAVFQNLMDNSVKYKSSRPVDIHIDVSEDTEAWSIFYRDNGKGVAAPERIFDLFYRENSGGAVDGSGVGLATCRKIIELHGGTISVEARSEGGSCFKMTLQKGSDF